jgi:hypothetical protein
MPSDRRSYREIATLGTISLSRGYIWFECILCILWFEWEKWLIHIIPMGYLEDPYNRIRGWEGYEFRITRRIRMAALFLTRVLRTGMSRIFHYLSRLFLSNRVLSTICGHCLFGRYGCGKWSLVDMGVSDTPVSICTK